MQSSKQVKWLDRHEWMKYWIEFAKKKNFKVFHTRYSIISEQIQLLKKDQKFETDIKNIRKKCGIPKLKSKRDQISIPVFNDEVDDQYIDSEWITRNSERGDQIYNEVRKLLGKYNLVEILYDFVEWKLLYDSFSKIPLNIFDQSSFHRILEDPNELKRILLTTDEKKFYLYVFGKVLGVKRRPKKGIAEVYRSFVEALEKSKNTTRRAKVKASKKMLKHIDEIGTTDYNLTEDVGGLPTGELKEHKYTSFSASEDIYTKINDPKILKRKASTLRKIKSRMRKRKEKLIGRN